MSVCLSVCLFCLSSPDTRADSPGAAPDAASVRLFLLSDGRYTCMSTVILMMLLFIMQLLRVYNTGKLGARNMLCYFVPPLKGAQSIVMLVCLSAHSHNSKTTRQTSPNFYACCLWPWLGPPLAALRHVKYFRFCGWCHVFISWANLAESSTTLYFKVVRYVAVPVGRQTTTVFGRDHQNVALGRILPSTIALFYL